MRGIALAVMTGPGLMALVAELVAVEAAAAVVA
jgi:hypothetical protein